MKVEEECDEFIFFASEEHLKKMKDKCTYVCNLKSYYQIITPLKDDFDFTTQDVNDSATSMNNVVSTTVKIAPTLRKINAM